MFDFNSIYRVEFSDHAVRNMLETLGKVYDPKVLYDFFDMFAGQDSLNGYSL
jgi:hypothetical protein